MNTLKKWLKLLLITMLLAGLMPSSTAHATVGAGEISFAITPDTAVTSYSFTAVEVGMSSAGYSAVNISYPAELQLNYRNAAISSTNKPPNWTVTLSSGSTVTTNLSILISAPQTNGMASSIESFLSASCFTLKAAYVYPPAESSVTIMLSEQNLVQYFDMDGTVHVYEFVEFSQQTNPSRLSWLQAFNAARGRSFTGKRGHLATLASVDEQMFVYRSIAQKPGWLGGTTLRYAALGNPMIDGTSSTGDISTNINDYTASRSIAVSWYWADGPEAGTVFYDRPVRDDTNGPVPGVFNFFSNNWTYNTYPEYRSHIQNGNEPNGDGGECCLQFAWSGNASWNDLKNDSSTVQGFYVEYDFPDGLPSSSGAATAALRVPIVVTFDVGNPACSATVSHQLIWAGDTATQPTNFVADHLYPNYGNQKFIGWFESPTATTPFNFATPLNAANTNRSSKTLFGKWEQYYRVSFDINNPAFVVGIMTQNVAAGGYPQAPLGLSPGSMRSAWNGSQYETFEFLGWFSWGENPANGVPYNFAVDAVFADIALHAEWAKHYQVSFDVNNTAFVGSPLIALQSVREGEQASAPSELVAGSLYPSFGNRLFVGWYLGGVLYDFSAPVVSDLSLQAHWEQYYNVTFTGVRNQLVPSQAVASGGIAVAPDTSTWSDARFTFYGWSDNSTDDYTSFTPYDFGSPIVADTILYGMWDPPIYTLAFDPNGGSWAGNITPQTREYCPGADSPPWDDFQPADIPPNPERPGYSFSGWVDSNTDPPPGTTSVVLASNRYFAQWALETYRIDYLLNGGTLAAGNPSTYSVENSVFPIDIGQPERIGYTFLGWTARYSNPSFPPISDPALNFSVQQGVTGDIVLEACWNQGDEYPINYELNGGATLLDNPFFYTIESDIQFVAPVKLGYDFLGWTVEGALTVSTPDPGFCVSPGMTGELFLTAQWSNPLQYPISYQLDGGVNDTRNPTSYTVNDVLVFAVPTKPDCDFIGWAISGGTTRVIPDQALSLPNGSTGELTLIAHWNKPPDLVPPEKLPTTGSYWLPVVALLQCGLIGLTLVYKSKQKQRKGYFFR